MAKSSQILGESFFLKLGPQEQSLRFTPNINFQGNNGNQNLQYVIFVPSFGITLPGKKLKLKHCNTSIPSWNTCNFPRSKYCEINVRKFGIALRLELHDTLELSSKERLSVRQLYMSFLFYNLGNDSFLLLSRPYILSFKKLNRDIDEDIYRI